MTPSFPLKLFRESLKQAEALYADAASEEYLKLVAEGHQWVGVALGDSEEALHEYQQQLKLYRRIHPDPQGRQELGRVLIAEQKVGLCLMALGRLDQAAPHLET